MLEIFCFYEWKWEDEPKWNTEKNKAEIILDTFANPLKYIFLSLHFNLQRESHHREMTLLYDKSLSKVLHHFIVNVITLNISTAATYWKKRKPVMKANIPPLGGCGENEGWVNETAKWLIRK